MNYFIDSKTIPYDLDDTYNYNYTLQNTAVDCFKIYVEIINVYISHFTQSKNIYTLNKTIFSYLFIKGIYTINHIFKLMLLYTKNLELTKHYCKQTIGYYVEFIEQNMQNEDDDIINYNNASRFSYSKTIDKLNKHCRKTSYTELDDNSSQLLSVVEEKESNLYNILNMLIEVYNKVLGAGPSGAGPSGACSMTIANHILDLVTDESSMREKLTTLLEFINNFQMKNENTIKYIYCLCEQLKCKVANKDTIIKN